MKKISEKLTEMKKNEKEMIVKVKEMDEKAETI
jgi:hypothetical protein